MGSFPRRHSSRNPGQGPEAEMCLGKNNSGGTEPHKLVQCFIYSIIICLSSFFKKRFYLFIFRERGQEGKREGEKHQCVVASRTTPTGDLAHNPGMCPDWESSPRPFGSQAGTQSTEPHQPGLPFFFLFQIIYIWCGRDHCYLPNIYISFYT